MPPCPPRPATGRARFFALQEVGEGEALAVVVKEIPVFFADGVYAAEILHGGDGELFNLVVATVVGGAHAPGSVAQRGAVIVLGVFDAVKQGLFDGLRRGNVAVDLRVYLRATGFEGGNVCRDDGIVAANFGEALPNGVMAVIGGGYGFGFAVEAGGVGGTGGDEDEGQQGVAFYVWLRVNLGEFWRDRLPLSSRHASVAALIHRLPQNHNIGEARLQIAYLRQSPPFDEFLRLKQRNACRVVGEDDGKDVFDAECGGALQHFLQELSAEAAAASLWRDVDTDFRADAVSRAWVVVAEAAPGANRAVRVFDDVERAVAVVRGKPRLPRCHAHRSEVGGGRTAFDGAVVDGDDGRQVGGAGGVDDPGHCVFPCVFLVISAFLP